VAHRRLEGGAADHPAWFNNMVTHPDDIWLEVQPQDEVTGESLHGRAREETLARIAAISPRYGGYQKKDRDPCRALNPRFGLGRAGSAAPDPGPALRPFLYLINCRRPTHAPRDGRRWRLPC
jgi:hypothetical protein